MKPKQQMFLEAYAEVGNLFEAARRVKVARRSHYNWLKDVEYAAAFAKAREQACEALELEARRRALEGIETPVLCRGKPCYEREFDPTTGAFRTTDRQLTICKYSDELLMFLLKAMKPEKYRDNWKVH